MCQGLLYKEFFWYSSGAPKIPIFLKSEIWKISVEFFVQNLILHNRLDSRCSIDLRTYLPSSGGNYT